MEEPAAKGLGRLTPAELTLAVRPPIEVTPRAKLLPPIQLPQLQRQHKNFS